MLRILEDQNDATAWNRTWHDKGDKMRAKGAYVQCMNKAWEMHMWGKVCEMHNQ